MASETVDPIDWSHPSPYTGSTPFAQRISRCNACCKSQDLLQPVRIEHTIFGMPAQCTAVHPLRVSNRCREREMEQMQVLDATGVGCYKQQVLDAISNRCWMQQVLDAISNRCWMLQATGVGCYKQQVLDA